MKPSDLPTQPLRGVDNAIRSLLNEMHLVVEARCKHHGVSGVGDSANAAALLLPLIGVEMVAERTRTTETKDASIRRVFGEIAGLVPYDSYGRLGFALFKLGRNGLAHGFYPNAVEAANGPKAGIAPMFLLETTGHTVCVEAIGSRVEQGHLTNMKVGDHTLLKVSLQHLYLDVAKYLNDFLQRLRSAPDLQELVERNDVGILQTATRRASEVLEERDYIALGT